MEGSIVQVIYPQRFGVLLRRDVEGHENIILFCVFKLENFGQLKPLSKFVSDEEIMLADSATLKLDNQKNGWK